MTEPAKPADQPTVEDAPKTNSEHAPNGVPPGVSQANATAYPTSDRQASETAALPGKK